MYNFIFPLKGKNKTYLKQTYIYVLIMSIYIYIHTNAYQRAKWSELKYSVLSI